MTSDTLALTLITVLTLLSRQLCLALRPPEEARRPKDILRLITYNRAREPTTEDFDKGFWRLDGRSRPGAGRGRIRCGPPATSATQP